MPELETSSNLVNEEYKYGFITDIPEDSLPKGLNEDIVRAISAKYYEIGVEKRLFLLFLVPTVFDWLENTGFLLVLNAWPEAGDTAAAFAVSAKKLKLGSLLITQPAALLLLLAGLPMWVYRRVKPDG